MKEHQHVEWKESWRDEHLKWISGFANAEGGVLVIGRNDKGKVSGVPDAKKLLVDLPNKVRDLLGIMVDVNLRTSAGRDYLEIAVPAYPNPIGLRGEYYYRSGSTNQTLKGVTLERFLLRKRGRHWDSAPEPSFTARSCSGSAMRLFKQKAASSGRMDRAVLRDSREVILGNLELTEKHGLRRAACLLFGDRPEKYVSGAWIKVGFFVTDDDLRYQDEVHGSLFEQVERTLELLHVKYLKAYISYRGLQRVETFPVPYAALREALLNAVVHKDYGSGIPIQISVYADKIVLWNSGDLPESWTLARLLGKHPSQPFNPLLANAFFRAGYIESWGRGIEMIGRECREGGIEPPLYDLGMSGLMLTFRASAAYLQAAARDPGVGTGQNTTQETTQETTQTTTQRTTQTTTQRILQVLVRNPSFSRREIAGALGDVSENGVKYHLERLKAAGRIHRVGADFGGRWEVVK